MLGRRARPAQAPTASHPEQPFRTTASALAANVRFLKVR